MNTQTKKRTVGVLVLIVIGVGLPFVLAHCLGGAGIENDGQTREIALNPGGNDSSADQAGQASDQTSATAQREREKQSSSTRHHSASADSTQGTSQNADRSNNQQQTQTASSKQSSSHSNGQDTFTTPPIKGRDNANQASQAPGSTASKSKAGDTDTRPGKNTKTSPSTMANGSSENPQDKHQAETDTEQDQNRSSGNKTASKTDQNKAPVQPKQSKSVGEGNTINIKGGSGDWIVQVASFKDRDHARQLIKKLKKRYASFYATGEVNGTTYYRVRVGPFETHKAAEQAAKALTDKHHKPYVRHQS